jgi:Zn finger protein HypA/HybF involved in hydrogenase expression
MHGLSAADAVLQAALAELGKRPGESAKEVNVKVGRLLFADIAQFTSAWDLIAQDTPLKSAKLTVEVVDGRRCALAGVVFG